MTEIIGIVALKGGVTKTTTSIFLATYYARQSKTVELLDLDPQLSAYEWAKTAEAEGQPLEFETVPVRVGDLPLYRTKADILIIDTPPGSAKALDAVANMADLLVIPTQPSGADVARVWRTYDALPNPEKARVLITRATLKTVLLKEAESAFEQENIPVLSTRIKERQGIKRSYGLRPPSYLQGYSDVGFELEEILKEKKK